MAGLAKLLYSGLDDIQPSSKESQKLIKSTTLLRRAIESDTKTRVTATKASNASRFNSQSPKSAVLTRESKSLINELAKVTRGLTSANSPKFSGDSNKRLASIDNTLKAQSKLSQLSSRNSTGALTTRSFANTLENPNILLNQYLDRIGDGQTASNDNLKEIVTLNKEMIEILKGIKKATKDNDPGLLSKIASGLGLGKAASMAGKAAGKAGSKVAAMAAAGLGAGKSILGKAAGKAGDLLKRIPGVGAFLKSGESATKVGATAAADASKVVAKGADDAAKAGKAAAEIAAKGSAKSVAETAAKTAPALADAAKVGAAATGAAASKVGTQAAEGVAKAADSAAKVAAKEGGEQAAKVIAKKVPVLGAVIGAGMAASRAWDGDWTGAGLELASGAASIIPGVGTAASLGIDGYLLARDMGYVGNKDAPVSEEALKEGASAAVAGTATAAAASVAKAATKTGALVPTAASGATKATAEAAPKVATAEVKPIASTATGAAAATAGAAKTGSSLADVIAKGESKGNYNIFNQGAGHKYKTGQQDFSGMTVDEVLAKQNLGSKDPNKLFAVGKYQIIPDTLAAAKKEMGLTGKEKFTPEMQDKIFSDYLAGSKRKDISKFIKTGEGLEKAALSGAQEWASIGVGSKGDKSYYAGDGINKAHLSSGDFKGSLEGARANYLQAIKDGKSEAEAYRIATLGTQAAGNIPKTPTTVLGKAAEMAKTAGSKVADLATTGVEKLGGKGKVAAALAAATAGVTGVLAATDTDNAPEDDTKFWADGPNGTKIPTGKFNKYSSSEVAPSTSSDYAKKALYENQGIVATGQRKYEVWSNPENNNRLKVRDRDYSVDSKHQVRQWEPRSFRTGRGASNPKLTPEVSSQTSQSQIGSDFDEFTPPESIGTTTPVSPSALKPTTVTGQSGSITEPIANLSQLNVQSRVGSAPVAENRAHQAAAANPMEPRGNSMKGMKGTEAPAHLDNMGIVLINTGML